MRYSHQRELIRNIVKGRFDHPTADKVYEAARATEPSISLGTVYRNLKQLAEDGQIETLETVDKKVHYDGRSEPHIHFICTSCHTIFDFLLMPLPPKEIEEKGCVVSAGKCVYYGECADCQE